MQQLRKAIRYMIGFAVRALFFIIALAFLVLPFILGYFAFLELAWFFQGYTSNAISIVLALALLLLVFLFLIHGNRELTRAVSEIPLNILDLGEALERRIVDAYVPKDVNKLSLAYALAQKGDKIDIQVKQSGQDPNTVQLAIHEQLRNCIRENNLKAFNELLAVVRDINAKHFPGNVIGPNPSIMRPLIVDAADAGSWDIVSSLIDHGADLNNADDHGGKISALHTATMRRHTGIVELLLDHGADPNLQDHIGHSALWWAHYDIRLIDILLDKGADPNLYDISRETVLDWRSRGKLDLETKQLVKLLEERGFKRSQQF